MLTHLDNGNRFLFMENNASVKYESKTITTPEKFMEVSKRDYRLVRSFKHPTDCYLWYVLCQNRDTSCWVQWTYNGAGGCEGMMHGYYDSGNSEDAARKHFVDKCKLLIKSSGF